MDELTVTRWARYGKERLYVATESGEKVGYFDVKTGAAVVERLDLVDAFQAAIARSFPGDVRAAQAPRSPEPARESTASAPEPGWSDLAGNRPGQAVQQQAAVHLAAMKEESRVGTVLARVFDAKTDERAWRIGAKGERTVGERLEKLITDGWYVLHSVPVGARGSDIDHVLIGPAGVYTINTKNHPGKRVQVSPHQIRVDGYRVEYLRNSRFEADRASKLLTAALGWEPAVRAALVLLTGTLIPDVTISGGGPDDVLILDRMDIPKVFRRAPKRLEPGRVAELFEVARRSTTWQPVTARPLSRGGGSG